MEKKITKKQVFEALIEVVTGMDKVGSIDAETVITTLETAVAQIDAKAAKAKEKAAEKKTAGDALRAEIEALLTDEFQTADAITEQVTAEDVTKSKVVSRLSQLVNNNQAEKEQIKTEDGRKIMAYRLPSGTDIAE